MKRYFLAGAVLMLIILLSACQKKKSNDLMEDKVSRILAKMTLHEKIGQMSQIGFNESGDSIPLAIQAKIRKGEAGSFMNVRNPHVLDEMQRMAVNESRLGIPILFGRDVIHGFRTIFPIPLAQAASWNPGLIRKAARVAALEASAAGIRWTFTPMIDISRDPRWGRIAESGGEDPYLTSAMGVAIVKGFQGENLSDSTSLAACGKHYAGYGAAEGGRDYNSTNIPENLLRDVYLVPFQQAVQNGLQSIMSAFNNLNGIPASGNEFTLRNILRNEWKFDGFVVSDYNSVIELINHGYAESDSDAAFKAVRAGVDMEMYSSSYIDYLEKLVKAGIVKQEWIDESASNILRVKLRLGLFDHPYRIHAPSVNAPSAEGLSLARELAANSMVLLRNENNILPLAKTLKNIAVIGPMADAQADQLGTWAIDYQLSDTKTFLNALNEMVGKSIKVNYAKGLETCRSIDKKDFNRAIDAAKHSEVVILLLGEEQSFSGEAHSRAFINLPGAQEDLVREIAKTDKPIIMVIMAGRPLIFNSISSLANAIIYAWHPGTMGGPALTDILFGTVNPSGKLPVSFPRAIGQIPVYYNHLNTGRPATEESARFHAGTNFGTVGWVSAYLDVNYTPEYPFGYGLSYSQFEYSGLNMSSAAMAMNDSIVITANLKNAGKYEGAEVAQLYIRDLVASITQPVKALKGFRKIMLKPGESKQVNFVLHSSDLAFHNDKMQLVTEPGKFYIWVGGSSEGGLRGEFILK